MQRNKMGDEIIVNYNGRPVNINRLLGNNWFYLRLPEFDEPSFPRVSGKNIAKRVMELFGVGTRWKGEDEGLRKDIIVENASWYFERNGTPDPYKRMEAIE